jgi:manganese-dependent inorganic pyrophosphatase
VDVREFGLEMFRARAASESFSAAAAVRNDLKEYRIGDATIAIAQVETVDAGTYLERASELEAALEELRASRGFDIAMLLVTDVVREGSHVFAVGRTRLVERALGVELAPGGVWMDGVLSRKKQVAARLLDASGGA